MREEVAALGALFSAAGIKTRGFSPERWKLWRGRLEMMKEEGKNSGTENDVVPILDMMDMIARDNKIFS